jgi:DNA-binding response OmpR family regulator
MNASPLETRTTPLDTILLVEDEVLIRLSIAEYLRHCGYRVFEAANADEGLTILQKADVQVDVVMSDIEMPGSMDGFGLAQWVRANRQGIDVVLVGTPQRAADAAAGLCEAGPTMMKPYEPQIVLDRIKQLLAARDRVKRP